MDWLIEYVENADIPSTSTKNMIVEPDPILLLVVLTFRYMTFHLWKLGQKEIVTAIYNHHRIKIHQIF